MEKQQSNLFKNVHTDEVFKGRRDTLMNRNGDCVAGIFLMNWWPDAELWIPRASFDLHWIEVKYTRSRNVNESN